MQAAPCAIERVSWTASKELGGSLTGELNCNCLSNRLGCARHDTDEAVLRYGLGRNLCNERPEAVEPTSFPSDLYGEKYSDSIVPGCVVVSIASTISTIDFGWLNTDRHGWIECGKRNMLIGIQCGTLW